LAIDRFFRSDFEDGSLLAMRHASISLSAIAFAKLIAIWLTTILPLIIATPMLALMLNMDYDIFWRTILSLLIGTPALIAFGGIGAAVTVSLKRGGLIAPVLILPLSIPILIFGILAIRANSGIGVESTAMLYLSSISLLAMVFSPFAIALALRLDQE
jgi:heme exporter protein B